MNIFLTGEVQIGKTTVIKRTIKLLDKNHGGFKTYFGPDRGLPNKLLYMNSAAEPNIFREEYGIVRFSESSKPQVIGNKFDLDGIKLIQEGRNSSELIIMDECGRFEEGSLKFQKEVLDSLEGNIPVLGVVNLRSSGWVEKIRNHPRVKLITVTEENRDELPMILVDYFNRLLDRR